MRAEEPARRTKRITILSSGFLILYVLSTGPVAWATNDGLRPPILSDKVNVIYWPLAPLLKVPWINSVFFYYTVILWGGYPAGYTTL